MLLPRLRPLLHEFNLHELCMMLNAYHEVGYLPKQFASEVEAQVKKHLLGEFTEKLAPSELAMIAKAFCKTRTASREFHKLLESQILMSIPEMRSDLKIIHAIGLCFEESGLCSLDTLKALKKEAFQVDLEKDVYA